MHSSQPVSLLCSKHWGAVVQWLQVKPWMHARMTSSYITTAFLQPTLGLPSQLMVGPISLTVSVMRPVICSCHRGDPCKRFWVSGLGLGSASNVWHYLESADQEHQRERCR